MKVSELEGAELHYWVARALGYESPALETEACIQWSTDRNEGGPIIEREKITVVRFGDSYTDEWSAFPYKDLPYCDVTFEDGIKGNTMLIAAMRCFVASRFGEVTPDRETT